MTVASTAVAVAAAVSPVATVVAVAAVVLPVAAAAAAERGLGERSLGRCP